MSGVMVTSELVLTGPDGVRSPEKAVEQTCRDIMEALLDLEEASGGDIHSASVGATLTEAVVSVEFCVKNVESIDQGTRIVGETLVEVFQRRLGHSFVNPLERSRDLELV